MNQRMGRTAVIVLAKTWQGVGGIALRVNQQPNTRNGITAGLTCHDHYIGGSSGLFRSRDWRYKVPVT